MQAARAGQQLMRDGEVVGTQTAAEVRAVLVRAARRYEARLAQGHEEEESVEAEAGAILEAETAIDIHELRLMGEAWMEAHRK